MVMSENHQTIFAVSGSMRESAHLRKEEPVKELQLDRIDSTIGDILIVVDGERSCSLDFADYEPRMMTFLQRRYGSTIWQGKTRWRSIVHSWV